MFGGFSSFVADELLLRLVSGGEVSSTTYLGLCAV